jgi:hypothetical protein
MSYDPNDPNMKAIEDATTTSANVRCRGCGLPMKEHAGKNCLGAWKRKAKELDQEADNARVALGEEQQYSASLDAQRSALKAQVATLIAARDGALNAVIEMVAQHCSSGGVVCHTFGLSANETAMDFLVEMEIMTKHKGGYTFNEKQLAALAQKEQ